MESGLDHHTARALLQWQIELGATDAIADAAVDRYALPETLPKAAVVAAVEPESPARGPAAVAAAGPADPVVTARAAAAEARTLPALRAALEAFDLCDLKKGARSTVFADGVAGARVMIVGEAPGRDEDREGRPFVGVAGQLLDRMLAAIGLDRQASVYITNVLPWRPPHNREPTGAEIAMLQPFLERHVALADPQVLVLMGNVSCLAVLGRRGITRMRGRWDRAMGKPVLPMLHPAYLLRQPQAKRDAWADLLELKAKLKDKP